MELFRGLSYCVAVDLIRNSSNMSLRSKETASLITSFFSKKAWLVIGASLDRVKFGNKVFRALHATYGCNVYPVNPRHEAIEGVPTVSFRVVMETHAADDLGVVIITPPAVSLIALREICDAGVTAVWLQPGACDMACLSLAKEKHVSLLHDGPCVLVELGYDDDY